MPSKATEHRDEFLKKLASGQRFRLDKGLKRVLAQLYSREFAPAMREFLDGTLGPISFFPTRKHENGTENHANKQRSKPVLIANLAQYYFPLAHTENREQKLRVAKYLLLGHDEHGNPLLARNSHVLLSLGSTVFFVAVQLAKALRDSIELGKESFTPEAGEPFNSGHWHTDSFELARLLGPLAAVEWAPHVLLCGTKVSRRDYDGESSRLNIPMSPIRPKRECDIVIMGCTTIDSNCNIYAGVEDDKDILLRHLAETKSTVFILATADKLGRPFNDNLLLKFDRRDRTFIVITDRQPALSNRPAGIDKVLWPGGQL